MLNKPYDTQQDKALAIIVKTTSIGEGIALSVTTTPLISGGFSAGRFAGAMDVSNVVNCSLSNLEIFSVAGGSMAQ